MIRILKEVHPFCKSTSILLRGDHKCREKLFGSSQFTKPFRVDKINKILGLEITFVTSASTDEECLALLKEFGIPFKKQ